MKKLFILFLGVSIALSSCKKEAQLPSNKNKTIDSTATTLAEMNRMFFELEESDIKEYIQKSKKKFQSTPSGLYYFIEGENASAFQKEEPIEIEYQVFSIKDSLIYDFTGNNRKIIIPNNLQHERGLGEGILLLNSNNKATLVVPSHLAFGALGDKEKIYPRMSLVYKILSVKKNRP